MKRVQSIRWVVLLLVVAALAGSAWGQTAQPERKLYDKILRGTAWVQSPRGKSMATGTGWVVDRKNRLLVTNYHVVREAEFVTVMFPTYRNGKVIAERSYYLKGGDRRRGRVLAREQRHDLALIQVETLPDDVEALPLAKESASPGDRVHTVGNPGASEALWVYTSGTVRQVYHKRFLVGRKGESFEINARIVETQAPTNPGDSGGPVVNDSGELVAVNDAHEVDARLVSICIDVSEVRALLGRGRPSSAPLTAEEYAQRGYEHAKRGEFSQAALDCSKAIERDPKHALAYAYRGAAQVSLKEYDKAIADCTQAIRLNPKLSIAYSNRGAAYNNLKEYDKAIADLNEALKLNARLPAAHFNRGMSWYHKGDYDKAITDLSEAIAANPKSANAHLWRGRAFAKKGETAKAEADLEEAKRLNPKLKD